MTTTAERRTILADVYRRACAGCEKSIARLAEMTRKRGKPRWAKCVKCGRPCRTYNLDGANPRCTMHRKHFLSQRERDRKQICRK